MDEKLIIDTLNAHAPPCVKTLGGKLIGVSDADNSIRMQFQAIPEFCHSGDIVQGGFITGMLDAAMSHAVFAAEKGWIILPTLEIKISFLEAVHPGELIATGRIVRLGKSVVFLEGELHDADNKLLATASSTARVIRKVRHTP